MKGKFVAAFAAVLMIGGFANAETSEALKVSSYTLDNGMTVWINEDPAQTAVYGAVVVKAGAVDCPGTGIAHYFEHMMFKGTDKIGTIDYQAEKPYLDSIAAKYDELASTTDDDARKAIQMEINRLNIKAADYAIPNEFDNLIAEMGGSGLNAFTSYDETVYHNKFLPEYFEQWAELNSERIMNPVFRLFQSELETVYEEKNRSDDNLVSDFQKSLLKNLFAGTGYSELVLGTTENLKNPRLNQMAEFFDKYYVANNMGLVLTGNISAEEALPVIEQTFGRIRRGADIVREPQVQQPINGRQETTAIINVPLVKIGALCYQGPSDTDADFLPVSFMTFLLNNDAGTGLLDKLMLDHKLMMAMAMPDLSFKDVGAIVVLYAPKLIGQSEKKAGKLIFNAIETLKKGDFTDDYFESCKMTYRKLLLQETEDLQERLNNMAFAFAHGVDWNSDVLTRADRIDAMTKADLVAIANKYLGDNYLMIHKKKGQAGEGFLEKPAYDKVVPKNREAASEYAQALRKSAQHIVVAPKPVDYQNDAERVQVAPMVNLFAVGNPYNDIFNLTLSFGIGLNERPELERMATYISMLGTEDKSHDEIYGQLQTLGSSVGFSASEFTFDVNITGIDENFDRTMALVSELLTNMKGDRKKLSTCKSDEKSNLIMNRRDMNTIASALFAKARFGENSAYIREKGNWDDKALLDLFKDVQKVECDVLYSGTLAASEVASSVAANIDVKGVASKSATPVEFPVIRYESPKIFFVDKKDAAQSQIRMLVQTDPISTIEGRNEGYIFSSYLGGGMSSLLFQEIREFRSLAYSTQAAMYRPTYRNRDNVDVLLMAFVGTQADKTIEAMTVVDSLVMHTPMLENKIESIRKELLNAQCNNHPDFRELPQDIAWSLRLGYTEDPVKVFTEQIAGTDVETMSAFWKQYISGRNAVWCIVGNSKNIDMESLAAFGEIVMLKASDVIKN